jgi:putative FmdB family regulatory protein
MPIYGYHCGRCGHEFEVKQSMADAPLKDCPECAGELRKLLYPVGVQFKGSGFYTTDYKNSRDGSKTSTKSSEEKSESGSTPSSSNGSDSGTSSSSSSEKKKKTEPAASKE